ncbi:electron transfer flavoprotein subunit alpha/FixB family protein [Desulfatiferula olefinivorans]
MERISILIIGETTDGRLRPATLELSDAARRIAGPKDRIVLALIGDDLSAACDEAARLTGLDVLYLNVPGLVHDNSEIVKTLVAEKAELLGAVVILTAHSSHGAEWAPGLAVRLSAACITGVNGIDRDGDGTLLFSRAVCGGNFNALIRPRTDRTVVTVQPGAFPARPHTGDRGRITTETHTLVPRALRVTGIEQNPSASSGLSRAKVIVAAGRGIGEAENLDLIRRFAALIPGSAVAGSRPLIDMGWLEYRYQVGITGAAVSPDVYIACGISGSSQHIAGMAASKFVVAVNTDPHAAIFNAADIGIVDDLKGFIETFEELVSGK